MKEERRIKEVLWTQRIREGAGVDVHRGFGFHERGMFDPFLLFDDFSSDDKENFEKGFPWHPHRGIETITYVIRGSIEHGDSLHNSGIIHAGEIQWMNAGSGIIHQELPKGDEHGSLEGFQLWANLPASKKMGPPAYQSITSEHIPRIPFTNGMQIAVIAGDVSGIHGPVVDHSIVPEFLDIFMPEHTSYLHPSPSSHTVWIYVISGRLVIGDRRDDFSHEQEAENMMSSHIPEGYTRGAVIRFSHGDHLRCMTSNASCRFLLVSGRPIREPIAWYGPIVMNTRKELERAFSEYREGTFLKTHEGR